MQRRAAERKLRGLVPFGVARFPFGVPRWPVECLLFLSSSFAETRLWVRSAAERGTILNGTVSCNSECRRKTKMNDHHHFTGLSHAVKGSSFALKLTMVCLAFLLSACRVDGTLEFQANGSMHSEMTFEDTKGLMAKIGKNCSNLKNYISSLRPFLAKATYEETMSENGMRKCRVISDEPLNNVEMKREGNNHLLVIGEQGISSEQIELDMTITIGVPGKIIKTTNGVIEGDKVVINGVNRIFRGVTITWTSDADAPHGSSSSDSSSSSAGGKTAAGSSADDSGFPAWVWIGSGVGVLALPLIVGGLIGRRKRRAAPPLLNLGQR